MTTLTITAKGQITLKKSLLQALGVRPGEKLDVIPTGRGGLELVPARPKLTMSDLVGILEPRPGPPVTDEEIQAGIEQGAVDRYLRGLDRTTRDDEAA